MGRWKKRERKRRVLHGERQIEFGCNGSNPMHAKSFTSSKPAQIFHLCGGDTFRTH